MRSLQLIKILKNKILATCSLCVAMPLHGAVSIVYNLRIAETTKKHISEKEIEHPYLVVATPFDQFRKKRDGISQMIGGALGTLMYSGRSWYIKCDFAGAHARERLGGFCFSRNQSDDFLITGGYSYGFNKRVELTASVLFGIPTHKDRSFEGIQFGYGHVGLGGQIDGDFIYSRSYNHSIRAAARLVHFFPRVACNYHDPALLSIQDNSRARSFNVHLGNLADIFITHYSVSGKHSYEFGYDLTSFFGTKIYPQFNAFVTKTDFIRSSFFGIYKYHLLVHTLPNVFTLALSYGFDMKPKIVSNKYIVTLWGSWSMSF